MTLVISHHQGWRLKQSAAAVLALLMLVECVLAVEPETCYSRQHQKAIVNVRQAVNKKGVLMDARVVRSERDCVLACCSEEVKPGAKCNMVVFNGNKQPGENNCFLFHCPAEQDCPLMKALDGINTYDIYKGLIHFTTMRPTSTSTISTSTSSVAPNTPTLPPTTAAPTTTSATTTISTTTQTPTTIPPSTTTATTTTATTTTTQSSITSSSLDREPPRLIIITPIPVVESTMTTTTTEVTSLQRPSKSSKKQNKNTKKGRLHPVVPKTTSAPTSATTTLHVTLVDQEDTYRTAEKPQPQTELCVTTTTTKTPSTTIATTTTTTTTTPSSTTTTTTTTTSTTSTTAISTTTSTTTTTAPTTTSTTNVPQTTSTTTKELLDLISSSPAVSLLIVPKGVAQPELPLQDQSQAKATTIGHGAVKSGVVAFMVLGLAMLTMALAIGGRKAMESFDRRHYTRLELNDLHYEV